jgi:dihydropteroate synthase
MKMVWRKFSFDFSCKTYIMGILNVTPDSFSDGGLHFSKSAAVERALCMVEEGADVIDVGGESTRPGSEAVSLDQELRRTIPVIEAIAGGINVPLSIDTYKSAVAEQALEAGAAMVNDISGLRFDPRMAEVVATYDVPVVLMHIKGKPRDMQRNPEYSDILAEIIDYLKESIRSAEAAGVSSDRMLIDPGIGFGKTYTHNLEIIHRLRELTCLNKPVLIGPSRKAFIGAILDNAPVNERLEGTAAAVALSVMHGADMVRVHDVKEMVKLVRVADAIKRIKIKTGL